MKLEQKSFFWQGRDATGKKLSGYLLADDAKELQLELKKSNIELINLQIKKPPFGLTKKKKKSKPVKTKDVLLFTRYMATMLAAGLPIIQILEIIAQDQENKQVKAMILNIKNSVEGGKTLAESFSQYPKQFNSLYCNLISAGEKSGTLDKILVRLAYYLERSENLKKKVKKALIYPAAILSVAAIVSLILLIFVVPQFQSMFKNFGAELPFFTQLVVNLSNFMRSYWWLFLGISIGSFITLRKVYQTNEKLQNLSDKLVLRIYIVGNVLKNSIIARFTRTLVITLEAGMPIVSSMNSMVAIVNNRIYERALTEIADKVVNGNQLSVAMRESGLFPNMPVQMIAIGEASGTLSLMLNKVADYYEEEVNTTVENLSSLLEPLIMLIIGVIVGGFVIAMYLPIFKIGSLF